MKLIKFHHILYQFHLVIYIFPMLHAQLNNDRKILNFFKGMFMVSKWKLFVWWVHPIDPSQYKNWLINFHITPIKLINLWWKRNPKKLLLVSKVCECKLTKIPLIHTLKKDHSLNPFNVKDWQDLCACGVGQRGEAKCFTFERTCTKGDIPWCEGL